MPLFQSYEANCWRACVELITTHSRVAVVTYVSSSDFSVWLLHFEMANFGIGAEKFLTSAEQGVSTLRHKVRTIYFSMYT